MKLQILIPQYNEMDDVIRPMLESINTQQGVNLKEDIEVIIGNDGSDIKLSEKLLNNFSYPIRYVQYEHTCCSGTRKKLFDIATADYVMFCDADDMFLSNLAFYMIFSCIDKKYDAIVCSFLSELIDKKNNNHSVFVPYRESHNFIHGKVYRREFLLKNNIVWYPDVEVHEDGAYNLLALTLARGNTKRIDAPLYLWKWRDNSICRKDPLYVLKTYTRMIYSQTNLVNELLNRGIIEEAKKHAGTLLYGTYYMLNKPIWLDPANQEWRDKTEKCIQEYYQKFRWLIDEISPKMKQHIIQTMKRQSVTEDFLFEQITFNDWLKHIEELE